MTDLPPNSAPQLTAIEARVVGCLIEKQLTTPESYPLTLNALVLACNQKTSREPVMTLEPGVVGNTLRKLEDRKWVRHVSGARAERWEHCVDKVIDLIVAQRALIGLMLLRGPQTLNELLTRSERMHDFDDIEHVRHDVERLITKGLAVCVSRLPGQREDRYMHLLCGDVDAESYPLSAALGTARSERHESSSATDTRIAALEAQVAALEQRLARLEEALGG